MKVITAPESYTLNDNEITCFLAGGITNCWSWQQEVIKELAIREEESKNLVVFNPRREHFPITDPSASRKQIEWEFKYLNMADIFSMYFCNADSDQPICMYELGRHLQRLLNDTSDIVNRVVIAIEDGYRRSNDVIIQTELALTPDKSKEVLRIYRHSKSAATYHAKQILKRVKALNSN